MKRSGRYGTLSWRQLQRVVAAAVVLSGLMLVSGTSDAQRRSRLPTRQIPDSVLLELRELEHRFDQALAIDCALERAPKGCRYLDHGVIDQPKRRSLQDWTKTRAQEASHPKNFRPQPNAHMPTKIRSNEKLSKFSRLDSKRSSPEGFSPSRSPRFPSRRHRLRFSMILKLKKCLSNRLLAKRRPR